MMKKILTIIFIFLNLSAYPQIYGGFKVGANVASVRFDNEDLNESFKYIGKPYWGYNAGFNANFYFSKVLNLKTELKYSSKGFKYEQTYYYGYKTFNYGQFSSFGQIDLNPDGNVLVSPFMGPYTAYWISGVRYQYDVKGNTYDYDKIYLNSDTTFAYNRFDSGIIVGVDFKFEKSNHKKLVMGMMYELGMVTTDIEKVDGWKNRNLTLYLELYYRLKKR